MRKNISGVFFTVLMLIILLPMQARAESRDEFLLDETGTVTIRSQHAGTEGVSSLQFSLCIDSADADNVSFQFGDSNAKITEFRYDKETKKLNIYMAGVEPLFADDQNASLSVGKIVAQDSSGNAVDANVSVVEDSLQYVYGTDLKSMEEVDDPGVVSIGPSAVVKPTTPPPTQVPPAGVTPQPEQPGQTQQPEQPGQTSQPEPPGQTQQPVQTPVASEETPKPGDNSSGSGNNDASQGSGGSNNNSAQTSQGSGSKRNPSTSTGKKVASAGTPKPSFSPLPSVSPSPEPEDFELVDVPEIGEDETNPTDEDTVIPAMGSTEGTGSEETGETENGGKTDWLMIVVVIAIVIFVAVAAIAVVVLKGKQKPHTRRD